MMQVSSRTEYGLRCLLYLAKAGDGKSLSLSEIAQKERVPRPYAEQILLKLRRAGIVKSSRGTQGGFCLAESPAKTSIAAIVQALEGTPFQDTCDHFNKKSSCGHLGDCSIRPVWEIVAKRLWQTLTMINLNHLLKNETAVGQTLEKELPVLTLADLSPSCRHRGME